MQRVVVCGQNTSVGVVCAHLIARELAMRVAVAPASQMSLDALQALATLHGVVLQKSTPKVLGAADILIFTDYSPAADEHGRSVTVAGMRQVLNTAMAAGFGGIVVVATRDSAVGTFFAQRISGLPKASVIGVGTLAVTRVFTRFLATQLQVPEAAVTAYAVGTQQAYALLWSRAYVGATPVLSLLKDRDPAALMGAAIAACERFAQAADDTVMATAVGRILTALAGEAMLTPVTTLVTRGTAALALAQPMLVDARGATLLAPIVGADAEEQQLDAIAAGVQAKLMSIIEQEENA
ncbi:Rossmann-fold NAD(P)-binding domain-containing protein [Lacticaseibacillus daqingensis]|uniref:lactate dehydrogenase n=1 Tax=Lacticaseibacillus daqingensis TaxID=2486014 RepID=UPI000F7A1F9E|nr:lactate dehydrogenase [Lacticaseibacillus daqingensis]